MVIHAYSDLLSVELSIFTMRLSAFVVIRFIGSSNSDNWSFAVHVQSLGHLFEEHVEFVIHLRLQPRLCR